MLFLSLVSLSFIQLSIAQQQYGIGILNNLFTIQKKCFCKCGLQRRQGWLGNGEPTSPSQFPWLVTVRAGDQYITGSLLTDRHVITAASPLYNLPVSNISVTLGSRSRCDADSGLASNIESVTIHPEFSPISLENDLALIRLKYVVPFDNTISPICLPSILGSREVGNVAYTVSYNASCQGQLVTLPVLSGRQCFTNAANVSLVTGDKGCLGPVGAAGILCGDDVGSPVMTQWLSGTSFHLIGVISSSDCASVTTPLYTRIADHVAWIKRQIKSACQCFSKF